MTVLQLSETTTYLTERGIEKIDAGIILGTGLSALVEKIDINISIPYSHIPNFPVSTVEFHKGQLIYGRLQGKDVLVFQGRFHFYEGYSMQQITFPVRVLKRLNAKALLLSNAAGGLNPEYRKGELILLDDHINMLPDNPLRGMNDSAFGTRFPDMSRPYSPGLNALIEKVALSNSIKLRKGIYTAVMGPNLETRAEYRFLRMAGADLVGMSTVPEVIVANQVELPCAAISVVTDECDPDNLQRVDIQEILEVAGRADQVLSRLLEQVIREL